jgi:cytochrome c peroxidase
VLQLAEWFENVSADLRKKVAYEESQPENEENAAAAAGRALYVDPALSSKSGECCEGCGAEMVNYSNACPSCELYNVAVDAQRLAAQRIATQKRRGAKDAWLNKTGVYAYVNGTAFQVGSAEEAAPFVALTAAARAVKDFMP